MSTASPNSNPDSRLAGWAASLMGSSLVLAFVLASLFISGTEGLAVFTRDHPARIAYLVLFALGYIVSFICLSRIRRSTSDGELRLWLLSLVGAATPVLIVMGPADFGTAALIICIGEVAAIVLHIIAIARIQIARHAV